MKEFRNDTSLRMRFVFPSFEFASHFIAICRIKTFILIGTVSQNSWKLFHWLINRLNKFVSPHQIDFRPLSWPQWPVNELHYELQWLILFNHVLNRPHHVRVKPQPFRGVIINRLLSLGSICLYWLSACVCSCRVRPSVCPCVRKIYIKFRKDFLSGTETGLNRL